MATKTSNAGFISIDELTFKSTQQATLKELGALGKQLAGIVTKAMVEFANQLLAQMKSLAPHKSGKLIESGRVPPPRTVGDEVIVEIKWASPYAWKQDQGGPITPKDFRASISPNGKNLRSATGRYITAARQSSARLFVPLRDGVKASAPGSGLIWGVDFVTVKFVYIPPTGFITRVLYGETTLFRGGVTTEGASLVGSSSGALATADRSVGEIANRLLGEILGK